MPRKRGLTARQERFVQEYLVDLNATQAAIRAGYSAKTADKQATQIIGKPWVAAAIMAAKQERARRTEVTAAWVLKKLRKNLRRAMQAEAVRDSDGQPTGEYRYEGAVANKALELMGRHIGMFVERHEHTGKDGSPIQVTAVPLDLSRLSTDELRELRRLTTKASDRRGD